MGQFCLYAGFSSPHFTCPTPSLPLFPAEPLCYYKQTGSAINWLLSLNVWSLSRGKKSLETICLLLAYKIKYPANMFLLRGNHESASINRWRSLTFEYAPHIVSHCHCHLSFSYCICRVVYFIQACNFGCLFIINWNTIKAFCILLTIFVNHFK